MADPLTTDTGYGTEKEADMLGVVRVAASLAASGVRIRTGTLLIALLLLVIVIGIIYAIWRFVSGGSGSRKPLGDQQDGFVPRDRQEPRSWQ